MTDAGRAFPMLVNLRCFSCDDITNIFGTPGTVVWCQNCVFKVAAIIGTDKPKVDAARLHANLTVHCWQPAPVVAMALKQIHKQVEQHKKGEIEWPVATNHM